MINRIEEKIKRFLGKLFSIEEVENSKTLQLGYFLFLISLTTTFFSWDGKGITFSEICLSHVSNCDWYKSFFLLIPQPYSYSESIFYVILYALLVLVAFFVYKKEYLEAHFVLLFLFLWKLYIVYGFSVSGNYDYYDIVLLAVFLFSANKLFFLRVSFVFLYFLASTIKIHDGWIVGTYFTSLHNGLPLFPDVAVPVLTNIVILTQMVACWLILLPKKNPLFKFFIVEFIFFHFYSGTIVNYRYILSSIPPLIILFLHPDTIPFHKKKIFFGSVLLIFLLGMQMVAIKIPGDQKLTLEGDRYGLYMFEANHQCVERSTTTINKVTKNSTNFSARARTRCYPDAIFNKLKRNCTADNKAEVSFMLDHSINGGPFYRVIDEKNICNLSYRPFDKNSWIKSELDNPKIVGYPVKNYYDGSDGFKKIKQNEDTIILTNISLGEKPELNSIQLFLRKYLAIIEKAYWGIWVISGITALLFFLKKLLNEK